MTNKFEQLDNIEASFTPIQPHKFTENTRAHYVKLIGKIRVLQQSKSLPSDYLSIIKSINRGRLVCNKAGCFHVSVSENLVERAINLLDALTRGLVDSGFKIKSVIDDKSSNFVVAIKDNEHISIHVSEGYKYQNTKPSKEINILDKLLYSNKIPQPTSKLTITLYARETKIGRSWVDSSTLIESKLPAIICGFTELISLQKQRRIQNEIREVQRAADATRFIEIESKRYQDKTIYNEVMKEAQSFKAHMELEAYLSFLELQYLEQYGSVNEQAQSWIAMARKIAQSSNPVPKRMKLLSPKMN